MGEVKWDEKIGCRFLSFAYGASNLDSNTPPIVLRHKTVFLFSLRRGLCLASHNPDADNRFYRPAPVLHFLFVSPIYSAFVVCLCPRPVSGRLRWTVSHIGTQGQGPPLTLQRKGPFCERKHSETRSGRRPRAGGAILAGDNQKTAQKGFATQHNTSLPYSVANFFVGGGSLCCVASFFGPFLAISRQNRPPAPPSSFGTHTLFPP